MTQAIITQGQSDIMEQVIIKGDLSQLSPSERVNYYRAVCDSIGLNPLTKPFEYIQLNGKLTLYARKDATDQLRKINSISIGKPDITFQDDLIIVAVAAHDAKGREDSDIGVVKKTDMRGDVANALMKAVTKAKRRVTLSLCGLGWLDETEVETIPDARPVTVSETGDLGPRWTEQAWTVDTASSITTDKGTPLGQCTPEQLELVSAKAKIEQQRSAAKFLLGWMLDHAESKNDENGPQAPH